MTFQTSVSPVPEGELSHLSDELIVPLGDALGAKTELSLMDWLFPRMRHESRLADAQLGKAAPIGKGAMRRLTPTSRALTLAEAQQLVTEAGVDGRVKVFEGQREEALKLEIEREQTKQKLENVIAHADQGWDTQLLIGATGVAVDFADPVNLATMAIPGVGAGKVAYGLTKATAKLAPTASKIIVRAGTGAYEGAVSTALAEPLNYAVHQSLGDDYGPADSANKIVTNAIGGAALHVLGGTGLDLYRGLRVRRDIGSDTSNPVSAGLQQIGALEPVNLPDSLAREQATRTRANPESSPAEAPRTKTRTGLGYARNSILVMPANGALGERVTFHDQANLNAVLREYDPVPGSYGEVSASGVKVFRIELGSEILVYTQLAKERGSPTTFTVERLRRNDVGHSPFSTKKAAAASGKDTETDRLLYIHPPRPLAERFAERLETTVTDLETLDAEQLFHRFQPSEWRGHTVDAEIGTNLHLTFSGYARASDELELLPMENGAKPDGAVRKTLLRTDLKSDSIRGRRSGQETHRKYRIRLNRETVIVLYEVKHHADRIAALNAKVAQAWDDFRPTWRKELKARKQAEAEARKAGIPSKRKQKQAERQQKQAERQQLQTEKQKQGSKARNKRKNS